MHAARWAWNSLVFLLWIFLRRVWRPNMSWQTNFIHVCLMATSGYLHVCLPDSIHCLGIWEKGVWVHVDCGLIFSYYVHVHVWALIILCIAFWKWFRWLCSMHFVVHVNKWLRLTFKDWRLFLFPDHSWHDHARATLLAAERRGGFWKENNKADDSRYYHLHLSILREYLDYEFSPLKVWFVYLQM